MKTIRIIDLLNSDKKPKKIMWKDMVYEYSKIYDDYITFPYDKGLLDEIDTFKRLNDEVEIIEEDKKIEKIPIGKYRPTHRIKKIEKKINEIIDYINKNEEEKQCLK